MIDEERRDHTERQKGDEEQDQRGGSDETGVVLVEVVLALLAVVGRAG